MVSAANSRLSCGYHGLTIVSMFLALFVVKSWLIFKRVYIIYNMEWGSYNTTVSTSTKHSYNLKTLRIKDQNKTFHIIDHAERSRKHLLKSTLQGRTLYSSELKNVIVMNPHSN